MSQQKPSESQIAATTALESAIAGLSPQKVLQPQGTLIEAMHQAQPTGNFQGNIGLGDLIQRTLAKQKAVHATV